MVVKKRFLIISIIAALITVSVSGPGGLAIFESIIPTFSGRKDI
jgi:hypothetical protein